MCTLYFRSTKVPIIEILPLTPRLDILQIYRSVHNAVRRILLLYCRTASIHTGNATPTLALFPVTLARFSSATGCLLLLLSPASTGISSPSFPFFSLFSRPCAAQFIFLRVQAVAGVKGPVEAACARDKGRWKAKRGTLRLHPLALRRQPALSASFLFYFLVMCSAVACYVHKSTRKLRDMPSVRAAINKKKSCLRSICECSEHGICTCLFTTPAASV